MPIIHEVNKGVGAAIVTGYKRALLDNMDIVAVMAGDNQMDPAFLPHLLDPIIDGKCDYTMGNRLASPEYRKSMSRWRLTGNAILTMLTKIASGYWSMMDPQNGYTAITTRALERMNLDEIYPGTATAMTCSSSSTPTRSASSMSRTRAVRAGDIRDKVPYLYRECLISAPYGLPLAPENQICHAQFPPAVLFYLAGVAIHSYRILWRDLFPVLQVYPGQRDLRPAGAHPFLFLDLAFSCICFAMFFDMAAEKGTNGWYS